MVEFGVDGHQDNRCGGFDLIDQPIPGTFSFPDVAVPHTHFEHNMPCSRYPIAYEFTCLESVYHRLDI